MAISVGGGEDGHFSDVARVHAGRDGGSGDLGIGFWTGHWANLVNVHMAIGSLFVIALWVIAESPARTAARSPRRFGFVWGVIVLALGMTQQGILIGSLHWIVRVLHLAIGIAAMPIAERLVAGPQPTRSAPSYNRRDWGLGTRLGAFYRPVSLLPVIAFRPSPSPQSLVPSCDAGPRGRFGEA
jgi:hypothetical protein